MKLKSAIEMAMANAFRRPVNPQNTNSSQFVKDVVPCKAFDMYGYSVGWRCFLKVRMLNPVHIYKCTDLLLSGNVTGTPMQPYESHIPYLLAFLADYNLYGCDWLEISDGGFSERHGSAKTVHSGREIDVDVTKITNRARIEHEKRHTQVFETQSSKISISSLSEARQTDSHYRDQLGIKPWTPQNLQPYHQSLARDWPWERTDEMERLLNERLAQESEDHFKQIIQPAWMLDLPTASELVPSVPLAYESVDLSNDEWILSQENTASLTDNDKEKSTAEVDDVMIKVTSSQPSPAEHREPRAEFNDSELISIFDQLSEDSAVLANELKPPTKLVAHAFTGIDSAQTWQFRFDSPETSDVARTNGVTTYKPVHFSSPDDVSMFPMKYGGREHNVKTLQAQDLPQFQIESSFSFPRLESYINAEPANTEAPPILEFAELAPSTRDVQTWLEAEDRRRMAHDPQSSIGTNPSDNRFQFISLESRQEETDEMVTCALEVHALTRPGKVPKPSEDPIAAVFWHVSGPNPGNYGVITTFDCCASEIPSVLVVESEQNILEEVIKMIRFFNPDILTGFETNSSSWGYVKARYRHIFADRMDTFYTELARVKPATRPGGNTAWIEESETVKGRHLMSLWNILRKEVTLSKYTLEHVVYHTLHERVPRYEYDDLTSWWLSRDARAMNSVLNYYVQRLALVLKLLAHFEIINRACERSRIIGVDFWSSLTRGSQFQVESVMCRLARRENYILVSPSKKQVGQQNALEYIPLVMEPRSELYTDPVCVLDFRSLYPSIVIALNLCYSTCIGRVDLWRGRNKVGIKQDHEVPQEILRRVGGDNIYVAPNGIGYVTPHVRKSLLAQMLGEILDTRFMLNETRKEAGKHSGSPHHGGARHQRNLNSKQLALKFIANVTYGYTSASFSGRMPCAELADSIVLAGREILTWCIRTIESTTKWGIKPVVVYGDTDSLFVKLPGVSKSQAFAIGREIAAMITESTPDPIVLKLEKIYSPCILLTKKRYVGHAFEHEQQIVPLFDAKGIETIRRDGTPIVQKIEKRALQILFDTANLSKVKSYLYAQWRRILAGREVNIQDFCFAQEVKLGHYKTGNTGISNLPGGAIVSLKKIQKDDGIEPQYRERVPFIITAGPAGQRINDRAVSPEEMMRNPMLTVDSEYYIQKTIIPPLERLFNLLGANIRDWYMKMPRTMRLTPSTAATTTPATDQSGTLRGFLKSELCAVCLENRRQSPLILCAKCMENQPRSRYILTSQLHSQEKKVASTMKTCNICSGPLPAPHSSTGGHPCQSIDCPIFYEREAACMERNVSLQLINSLI